MRITRRRSGKKSTVKVIAEAPINSMGVSYLSQIEKPTGSASYTVSMRGEDLEGDVSQTYQVEFTEQEIAMFIEYHKANQPK